MYLYRTPEYDTAAFRPVNGVLFITTTPYCCCSAVAVLLLYIGRCVTSLLF